MLITGYLATEKPMMQRKPGLPSLDGLRYFDAAARNLSFTRAAQDLFLTQSAVSQKFNRLSSSLAIWSFTALPRDYA